MHFQGGSWKTMHLKGRFLEDGSWKTLHFKGRFLEDLAF